MTLLMTASKLCCRTGPERSQPSIEASLQGFSSQWGLEVGGEGESLAPGNRSPTVGSFVARLLTLSDVDEPGGL